MSHGSFMAIGAWSGRPIPARGSSVFRFLFQALCLLAFLLVGNVFPATSSAWLIEEDEETSSPLHEKKAHGVEAVRGPTHGSPVAPRHSRPHGRRLAARDARFRRLFERAAEKSPPPRTRWLC